MGGLEEQGGEGELGGRVGGKQELGRREHGAGRREHGGGRGEWGGGGRREGKVVRRREQGAGRGSWVHCNYNSFTITIRYHRLPGAQQCLEPRALELRVWELRVREAQGLGAQS